MRTLDEIAQEAVERGVRLAMDRDSLDRAVRNVPEGLFHVPLISLVILVILQERRGGLQLSDVSTWTLATLLRHSQASGAAKFRNAWSLQVRKRCAEAIVFLENRNFVVVDNRGSRFVSLAPDGREFIRTLFRAPSEAGMLARSLRREYSAVEQVGLVIG